MARRRLEGLERVLGVNALFSTAYGNVGSSIYYALGLVASYALGLTPIVFIITGFFFFCTAASYAEATTMYPEAGGSSSFARRAFNEFWSFFAAWAQMLTYVATIATSAIFFTLPAVALSALPVKLVDGSYQTLLGLPDEDGGFAGDPVLGVVRQLDLGFL